MLSTCNKSVLLIAVTLSVLMSHLLLMRSSYAESSAKYNQVGGISHNQIASSNNRDNSLKMPEINSAIRVNSYPIGIAANPSTNKVYVTNEFSNTVSIIDGTTDKVETTINVGSFPYGIDVNTLNNRIYVSNRGSDSVSVIDGATNTKIANVSAGKSPVGVAVNPSTSLIYITNIDSNTVSIIDGLANTLSGTIRVGNIPYGVVINPATNRIYVTNIGDNTVSVIDGKNNRLLGEIKTGSGTGAPAGIAINISANRLYVTDYLSNSLFVIDTLSNKLIHIIKVGKNPVGLAVNPVSDKIYITNIGDNTVSVIDGVKNQVVNTIGVIPILKTSFKDSNPLVNIPVDVRFPLITSFVAVNSATNTIYLTNAASNTVSTIDGNKDAVVVRLNFDVNPPHSGDIECNGLKNFGGNSTLYARGEVIQCVANPNRGYIFDSWSSVAKSLSNPLTFEISQFGTLTANFDPTFPPETYLFIILGSIGSVPIFWGWFNKDRQKHYLNTYLTRIEATYDKLYQTNRQEYLAQLQQISKELLDLFRRGKLSDSYYNILDRKASEYISLGK
jgi:YVTN family beta-propeller protein